MLINLSVQNWMSFSEKATLSLVASKERQHGDRIPHVGKYPIRILPITAIYGGNASGKSNLFKTLSFAKDLIVEGTRIDSLIPVDTFHFDTKNIEKPAYFSFELLIDEIIFEFSFSVTKTSVVEEKLVKHTSTNEHTLYERKLGGIKFDKSIDKDPRLGFAFKGTRDNQLFLTNSVSQKVETFKPIYDWFKDSLELISPDSSFGPFEHFLNEDNPLYSTMNAALPLLDTGIIRLGSSPETSLENIRLPEKLKKILQENVKEGVTVKVALDYGKRIIVTRKDTKLVVKELITYHPTVDGGEMEFETHRESDGSKRVIDLLPAFLELASSKSSKTYVIDEIDRSLHTLLTRQLIEAYLETCNKESRSQLLLTTHDVLLMDQELFRRDEMWVTERDSIGRSTLIPFSEYKDVRYDKDIRKSYLQGRLGGIPRILLDGALSGISRETD